MCTRPVNIKDPSAAKRRFRKESSFLVGCGKCPECLKDRQNSWKLRLIQEASQWCHVYFFTLTYNETNVPRNDLGNTTASVKDVQDWIKRFRTNFKRSYGVDAEFKYFICAEYGPEGTYFYRGQMRKSTMRPHYHGMLFTDYTEDIVAPMFRDWESSCGYYQLDEICKSGKMREERSSVANYCSKYCCKGEFASRRKEIERGEIERAFTICSNGIGASYISRYSRYHLCGCSLYLPYKPEVIQSILSRKFVIDGSFKYKMPRYYSDRIYKVPVVEVQEVLNLMKNEREIKKAKRFSSDFPLPYQISCALSDRVRERTDAEFAYIESCRAQGVEPFVAEAANLDQALREKRISSKLRKFYSDCAQRNAGLLFTNI